MDPFTTPIRVPDPASLAVICGHQSLTFRELDDRARRLANVLHSRGIGRGHFVGVGLPRSIDLPVALLAILRTGAAYVPLDPTDPPERIARMIAAADLKHVLTRHSLAEAFTAAETIFVEDSSDVDFPAVADMDALMYAIFASRPAAATVSRRGFSNLLDWYTRELSLGPADRTLVIGSPGDHRTQKNLFAPLITGGTLILDEGVNYDVSRINALIRDQGVTLINCLPGAFYPLVDAAAGGGFAALASLRFAVLGGEPVSISRLRAWLEHPNCRAEVINTYDFTECTDTCAFHRLHRGNLDDHPFVPLGREIPNVRIFIRDEAQIPLPDGGVGELCIGGASAGGGYLNDPQRSAASFTGALFRTGDLARRHPSGMLEFIGRVIPAAVREDGRVDRLAPANDHCPHPATDTLESRILQLWSEVLGHHVTDATTNLLDLGGNPALAEILRQRLMEMTGRRFPVAHLFALSSARAIASFLLAPVNDVATPPLIPVRARRTQTGFARFKRPALR